MSLRSLTKVYGYTLVLFAKDKTYSILPLKNIVDILEGSKAKKGSKVVALYNGENFEAEVYGVHDDPTVLQKIQRDLIDKLRVKGGKDKGKNSITTKPTEKRKPKAKENSGSAKSKNNHKPQLF